MKRNTMYSGFGILASVLFLLSAAGTVAFAQEGEHMGPPSEEHMGSPKGHHEMTKEMEADMAKGEKAAGMTEDQRSRMKALREEFRGKQQALRDQMKVKKEALRQELDSNNPDRTKAESIAKELNALQGQASLNRIDEVFKIRTILTPEQFQKLKAFHEKNKGKFREKMKEKMKGKMGDRAGKYGGWRGKDGMTGEEHGEK
jgi:Spy/CpxP family protein refolding chaperone